MKIRTTRLDLVAATLAHVEAELRHPGELGRLLQAELPASWPPGEHDRAAMEFFRARLLEDEGAAGWYGWYAVHRPERDGEAVVVGSGGYLGPPASDGSVEIGFSIAPEFQGRGFAAEMVRALVSRAFDAPGVDRVIAHALSTNDRSIRLLLRCGFTPAGAGGEPGTVRHEKLRPAGG